MAKGRIPSREAAEAGAFFTPGKLDKQHLALAKETLSALGDIDALCDAIESSDDPEDMVHILLEILFQKDQTWVHEEGGNDTRLVFFYCYFSIQSGSIPTVEETMQLLHTNRNDSTFFSNVVQKLPAIRELSAAVKIDTKKHARAMEREHKAMQHTADEIERLSVPPKEDS